MKLKEAIDYLLEEALFPFTESSLFDDYFETDEEKKKYDLACHRLAQALCDLPDEYSRRETNQLAQAVVDKYMGTGDETRHISISLPASAYCAVTVRGPGQVTDRDMRALVWHLIDKLPIECFKLGGVAWDDPEIEHE